MISWDCFDTLLARSYKEPRSIFNIVAKKINDPSFAKKRIDAEKRSSKKTYEDIYSLLPGYDPQIEFDVEKEFSFPIAENFNRVSDGDVIVSDMYFSSDQIRALLEHHGFNKNVDIFVTYSGKHTGASWSYLRDKHPNVSLHIGDNLRSDVSQCRNHNFNSLFFGASNYTPEENSFATNNHALATLMRRSRLSNPYHRPRSSFLHKNGSFQNIAGHYWIEEINGVVNSFYTYRCDESSFILRRENNNQSIFVKITKNGQSYYSNDDKKYISLYDGYWLEYPESSNHEDQRLWWIDQSQFNLPILALVSTSLPKNKKIRFSERDCYYLYRVYNAMYPHNAHNTAMLDVCRKGYYYPYNQEYINYVIDSCKDALIVDSHGTGNSANHFFKSQGSSFDLYHICKHPVKKRTVDTNQLSFAHHCERKFLCSGRFFEKHNIYNKGTLLGWENGPVRALSEHNNVICDTITQCIDNICSYIHYYLINNDSPSISTCLLKLKGTFTEQTVKSIGA